MIHGNSEMLNALEVKNLTHQEIKSYQELVSTEKNRLKPESQRKQTEHGGVLSGDFEITVIKENNAVDVTFISELFMNTIMASFIF